MKTKRALAKKCCNKERVKNSLSTFGYETNKMEKTIKIKGETHQRLLDTGNKGETFDALFNRLLDSHKNTLKN
jgi:hypothetical protein